MADVSDITRESMVVEVNKCKWFRVNATAEIFWDDEIRNVTGTPSFY